MEENGKDISDELEGAGKREQALQKRSRAALGGNHQLTIINRPLRRELSPKLLRRKSRIQNPKSKNPKARIPKRDSRTANRGGARGPSPLTWVKIRKGARTAVRELFEKAMADPSSDAYRMLEIMCLNELVEVQLKTREMDALEVFRARNQG